MPDHAQEIERLTRLYSALTQLNRAIVRKRTRAELFQRVCDALVDHGGFGMAWIGWHDPETHRLMPVSQAGDDNRYLDSIEVYADDRPEGRGPSGRAFREDRPYVCNDLSADPGTGPWRAEQARRGFCSSAVVPIHQNERVVGTLSVYADRLGVFREQEMALMVEAAADISFAIDRMAAEEAHRRAEETAAAIVEREQRFAHSLIEAMPSIFYLYDDRGRFLRWNQNFERVSGYSAEEIAVMHPLQFFKADEQPLLEQRIGEVLEIGEATVEASFLKKDGSSVPYFFTGRRIVLDGMRCLVGVGVDISERRRAEQALHELNENLELKVSERTLALDTARERAESADRIKSAFLATMSHELRTPLNSILGFTGIVLKGMAGPLNQEQSKQLGMVQGSARHLLDLINDVLDISKIEAGQLEMRCAPFDLRASIERVAASVAPQAAKKGLTLRVELPERLDAMESDRRRVEQIVLNLLNNALKFTDRGGVTLTVETDRVAEPEAAGQARAMLRIAVADTGIGIKQEDLPILFLPFRQIDSGLQRTHEGTGLGLAICSRLTVLLGGTIRAESVWGQGSVFSVVLPMTKA
jgi:PAS domain S-box-containing protein